jgi:hypothetical protein
VPTYEELLALLRQKGVNRGISKKRMKNLLFQASEADSGIEFTDIVAIGLPAKDGKPSRLKSLFPHALDRILQPQEAGNNKVNMRNLGDILCVQAKIAVAKREPPGKGREGYTVTDSPLNPMDTHKVRHEYQN